MGHGTVADEIKGRSRPSDRAGRLLSIDEQGARFRSYIDGSEQFLAPETSMEIQAALGSDIALVFDECTPLNVDRDYTARSTQRTHRWLRPVPGLARRARARRPARLRDRAGRRVRGHARGVGRRGDRRERLRRDRDRRLAGGRQAADVRGRRLGDRGAGRRRAPAPPARDRRRRRPDRRRRAGDRHVRLRDADAAGPPRDGARPRPRGPLAPGPGQGALGAVATSR